MVDGRKELTQRVSQLDDERGTPSVENDVFHFITVLQQVTSSGLIREFYQMPYILPAYADDIVAKCRLLTRLASTMPAVVTGPLLLDSQYWIYNGKPAHVPRGRFNLSKETFNCVSEAVDIRLSTKPFSIGLFTSTGMLGKYGMWRAYLEINRESTLNPLPWYTWSILPRQDAIVHEISTATQWVDFILSYPLRDGLLLFPDWKAAAQQCDAIHMSMRAVCATQGLYFLTKYGMVAPTYWDVESTLWLRWCFSATDLVEVVTV